MVKAILKGLVSTGQGQAKVTKGHDVLRFIACGL